jgi:hypothetical protein
MDVSNACYYTNIHKNNKNKGSQMGHTNTIFKKIHFGSKIHLKEQPQNIEKNY